MSELKSDLAHLLKETPELQTAPCRAVFTGDHYLQAVAADEPGPGGANHLYEIGCDPHGLLHEIKFQKGPIQENAINGVTNEVLLHIVADRLRAFQGGPFNCNENGLALQGVVSALFWLDKRTADRNARGVEGKTLA